MPGEPQGGLGTGARVQLKSFPAGWLKDGRDVLLASLKAQLEVFGPLKVPIWVSPNLKEAEAVFADPAHAKDAIEVLNGVDFREAEELARAPDSCYEGLAVSLAQPGGRKRPTPAGRPGPPPAKVLRPDPGSEQPPPSHSDFAELEGVWSIGYEGGENEMTYTIGDAGEVRVGKKRWLQLVPAGSLTDGRQDPNYSGTFLLNDAHREDTWEYLWLEGGQLQIHHFTGDDTGVSPKGSPNFWGAGIGVLTQADVGQAINQNWQQPVKASKQKQAKASWQPQQPKQMVPKWNSPGWAAPDAGTLADFEGVWNIIYEGQHEGSPYTISATGEVAVSKKRRLQLVPAGSPHDMRQDPNYAAAGVFLLESAHREGTWEFLWLECGRLCIHHFTSDDQGVSPYGSPNYWGAGEGIRAQENSWGSWDAWGPSYSVAGAGHAVTGHASYWRPTISRTGARAPIVHMAGNWQPPRFAATPRTPAGPVGPPAGGCGLSASDILITPSDASDFEGAWSVVYMAGGGAMTYTIGDGEVRVGKKRRVPLVPACSEMDVKQDSNYLGTFFLNDVHREDTWEYIWIQDGVLQVHHFTGDDTGISPLGSPNFFGAGEGTRR